MLPNQAKFAIVAVIVNLHTLRNLSFAGYIAIYALMLVILLFEFLLWAQKSDRRYGWGPLVTWVLFAACAFVVSIALISPGGAVTGLSRFLFALPILLALTLYTDSLKDVRDHMATLVVIFAVASATLPLQIVTGPIPWFATASERAGIDRFASLVGSLTSIGIIVGCYLVLAQGIQSKFRWFWSLIIAGSAAISLSKAAIANVGLAFAVILVVWRQRISRLLLGVGASAIIAMLLYASLPFVQERVDASLVSFGIQNATVTNYDATAEESLIDRLTDLPRANIEGLMALEVPFVYLLGAGFGMGNSALVPDEDSIAPMAHNQYVELFTVFGAVGAIALGSALVVILGQLIKFDRAARSDLSSVVKWAFILLLINGVAANGTFYQPTAGSVFFFCMFVAAAWRSLIGSECQGANEGCGESTARYLSGRRSHLRAPRP